MASTEGPITGLALRYATALFELGSETGGLDALDADFSKLKALLGESPELTRLVRSPLYSREDQARAMKAVLVKAQAAPITTKLVLLLAQKGRLFALRDDHRFLRAASRQASRRGRGRHHLGARPSMTKKPPN